MGEVFGLDRPELSNEQVKKLYSYPIPKPGPKGSCGLKVKAKKPYSLALAYGLELDADKLKDNPHTFRLWRLNQIVKKLAKLVEADWLGVYRTISKANEKVMIKEAYVGAISGPEFPLNREFAKTSNNSLVGMTGKGVIVKDVRTYEGPYYECDSRVKSECCLPIFDPKKKVIGIIDAEDFEPEHFDDERVVQIAKVCFGLGQRCLGLKG